MALNKQEPGTHDVVPNLEGGWDVPLVPPVNRDAAGPDIVDALQRTVDDIAELAAGLSWEVGL